MSCLKVIRRALSIDIVKAALKGGEGKFERVLQKVKLIKAEDGNCVAELKIEDEHTNPKGTLHGGLSATIVDSLTTYALFTHKDAYKIPTVSVDLHLTFLKGAQIGDEIIVDSRTTKVGKTLAFTTCEIRNKKTGDLLTKGNHTKYVMRPKK